MASADFEPGARLRALERNLSNPSGILKSFGALIASRAQRAFRDQRRGPFPWKPRANPNVPGILSDMKRGRTPPNRRFVDRPAGIDEGHLWRSISWRIVPGRVVEIGSTLPYAGRIQNGGEENIDVTPVMKERLRKYLDGLDSRASREQTKVSRGLPSANEPKMAAAVGRASIARKSLGYLLNPKVTAITWTTIPRPFVAVLAEDVEDFRRIITKGAFA